MKYLKVKWSHTHPEEPVWLYSEVDESSREQRKVEVFSGGLFGYADRTREHGSTRLGTEPLPPISAIAADSQFEPLEITATEFEEIWNKATKSA